MPAGCTEEFWKRIKIGDSVYRQRCNGMRLELNGITLFARDGLPPKSMWMSANYPTVKVVEAISGMEFNLRYALICSDQIRFAVQDMTPVDRLTEWR